MVIKQHLGISGEGTSRECRISIQQSHQVCVAGVVQRTGRHEGPAGGGHECDLQQWETVRFLETGLSHHDVYSSSGTDVAA